MVVAISRPLLDAPIDQIIHDCRSRILERAFILGNIQVLSLACATSVVESRHDGRECVGRIDEVGVSAIRCHGLAIGPPGQAVVAGNLAAARLPNPAYVARGPVCPCRQVLK